MRQLPICGRKANNWGSKSDPLIENGIFYFFRPRFVAIEMFGLRAFAEERALVLGALNHGPCA
jgi:hypothetical protein